MDTEETQSRDTVNLESVQYIEAQLLKHSRTEARLANEWVPAWSSMTLGNTLKSLFWDTKITVKEMYLGLWNLLSHTNSPLTPAVAEFLYVTIRIVMVYRSPKEWQSEDYEWMIPELKKGSTTAQAYLAAFVLAEEHKAVCRQEILLAMQGNEFLHRVLHIPGIMSPDVVPYGYYQIEPLVVESQVANGVLYNFNLGAVLGTVVTIDGTTGVKFFRPFIPAPSHWQELIQTFLGSEN